MRIIRNGVNVSMGLEELIELMENELIDEVIDTLIELDDAGIEAGFVIALDTMDIGDEEFEGIFFLDPDGNELDIEEIKEGITKLSLSDDYSGSLYTKMYEDDFLSISQKDYEKAWNNILSKPEDRRVRELLELFDHGEK